MGFFRTALLLAALTALFMGVGSLLGGGAGARLALIIALVMNLGAWWFSDKMALAYYRAKEVDATSAPQLYGMVKELAARANLPMPRVYISENAQPNAFATGRNPANAAVCATTGLLQRLNYAEIRGVMAHELAHIKHHDTLIMTMTATIAGALANFARIAMFSGASQNGRFGVLGVVLATILAPIAASLVQFAISRTREYAADRRGAEISGDPLALASALANIHRGASRIDMPLAEANPASAHMFIANPLHVNGLRGLFTTHPPMEERIARLQAMAHEFGPPPGHSREHDDMFARREEPRELETTAPPKGPWG